ncbi:xanthine dehydrogenase subunit D [Bacillus alkalicellulosilyticus]|uniref:xanthine dehydrogenase subunit D n=1 Tax=Alkalihalobacterium alkalicellulosilyticum TaxID=1912214 RepID=UPI0009983CA2|nr:xanthine dehydrogenase subunit D [Bacillus alkalicellulosilyticus]
MLLNRKTSAEKWKPRPDGEDKVKGKLRYLTDLKFPNMLYGRVLRSAYPHATLTKIDISKAMELPGVVTVLTHADVPGLNGFGISNPDQPVFCEEKVQYEGDAIAAVAAVSDEIAEKALALIEVQYEELPVINSPEEALKPSAPPLHVNGNILHQTHYVRGNMNFQDCLFVVEETYYTPRQMHTYLETEGGVFVPETNGNLTVYAATQHGYKDRMQLSRILAIPEEAIRVISSPIGGSFGGKDELNVQPYGALLALQCGNPVKMHNSRWESVRAGLKRHPMKVTMKTGVNSEGKLVAHKVDILSDTGAYSTLGAPVLNFATEHSMGPYIIENVEVNGKAVFTNNGVSGEFRGFGGNQVIFALEGQLDRLAEKLNIDPWELRRRNLREEDDLGPLGQHIVHTNGAFQVWDGIQRSPLWEKRESVKTSGFPWISRGIGAAIAMHGSGLGYGIPDPAGGIIRINGEGKIEVAFGYEEFGQGIIGTLEIIIQDIFGCDRTDIHIIIGDTARVPHSGSSTASRSTSMIWQALQRLKTPFLDELTTRASQLTHIPKDQLKTGVGGMWSKETGQLVISYQDLIDEGKEGIECSTEFHFPVTPDPVIGGHYLYTCTAVVVEVEVNGLTGTVTVNEIDHAVAAGPVVNPMGYLGQIEGGSIMALGFTLTEDAVMEKGRYLTKNLDTYLIPTLLDVPEEQRVEAIEELPPDDQFGPRGVGEVGSVALAPAIVAAIKQATGKWITKLPISKEELLVPLAGMDGKEGVLVDERKKSTSH